MSVQVFKEKDQNLESKISNKLTKIKVLVVDDEKAVLENIHDHLSLYEADVYSISSGLEIEDKIMKIKPDIILIDYKLKDNQSGIEIIQKIRKKIIFSHIPIIMITGLLRPELMIEAMASGADAVFFKPFHPYELTLKIMSLLKINRPSIKSEIKIKDLKVDLINNIAYYNGEKLNLYKKAIDLLVVIMQKLPNRRVPFEEVLKAMPKGTTVRSLDVHVCVLRKELRRVSGLDVFRSRLKGEYRAIYFTYGENCVEKNIEEIQI